MAICVYDAKVTVKMRMKSVARQVEALGGLASDLRSCRVLLKCI